MHYVSLLLMTVACSDGNEEDTDSPTGTTAAETGGTADTSQAAELTSPGPIDVPTGATGVSDTGATDTGVIAVRAPQTPQAPETPTVAEPASVAE